MIFHTVRVKGKYDFKTRITLRVKGINERYPQDKGYLGFWLQFYP
jgi:hypothetical protein